MEDSIHEGYMRGLHARVTCEGYLRKWIVPRWGATNLSAIRAVEVELWLRTLPLARASRAKIRNLMSVLFNHARRHDFSARNPITLVRQNAKAAHCGVADSAEAKV
jgi:integrase